MRGISSKHETFVDSGVEFRLSSSLLSVTRIYYVPPFLNGDVTVFAISVTWLFIREVQIIVCTRVIAKYSFSDYIFARRFNHERTRSHLLQDDLIGICSRFNREIITMSRSSNHRTVETVDKFLQRLMSSKREPFRYFWNFQFLFAFLAAFLKLLQKFAIDALVFLTYIYVSSRIFCEESRLAYLN